MSYLSKLIGKKVVMVSSIVTKTIGINQGNETIEEPIIIVFEEYTLSIYNPFSFDGLRDSTTLRAIENLILQSYIQDIERISMCFDNNVTLNIDMRNESFRGPEAITLRGPDNLFVVWN